MTDPRPLGYRHANERAAGEARGGGAYEPALAQAHESDLQAAIAELDDAGRAAFMQAYMQGTLEADRERAMLANLAALPPDPGPMRSMQWASLAKLQARSRYLDVLANGQAMFDALDPERVGDPSRPLVSADALAIHTEKNAIDREIARRAGSRWNGLIVLTLLGLAAATVVFIASRT